MANVHIPGYTQTRNINDRVIMRERVGTFSDSTPCHRTRHGVIIDVPPRQRDCHQTYRVQWDSIIGKYDERNLTTE